MKNIKDYLHLYFYSEIELTEIFIKVGYQLGQRFIPTGGEISLALRDNPVFACKPILRPLLDMTEDEGKELDWTFRLGWESRWDGIGIPQVLKPEEFRYLLSKGFDLFGLIHDDIAIDKTTLK